MEKWTEWRVNVVYASHMFSAPRIGLPMVQFVSASGREIAKDLARQILHDVYGVQASDIDRMTATPSGANPGRKRIS